MERTQKGKVGVWLVNSWRGATEPGTHAHTLPHTHTLTHTHPATHPPFRKAGHDSPPLLAGSTHCVFIRANSPRLVSPLDSITLAAIWALVTLLKHGEGWLICLEPIQDILSGLLLSAVWRGNRVRRHCTGYPRDWESTHTSLRCGWLEQVVHSDEADKCWAESLTTVTNWV